MKAFLDTNVIIAAFLVDHEHHSRAWPLLESIHTGHETGHVSAHTLLEIHSVLTRFPRSPRITPSQASTLIVENILKHFSVIALTAKEYASLAARLGLDGIAGGRVYDALQIACAIKADADRIYTFNIAEFRQLAGREAARITTP